MNEIIEIAVPPEYLPEPPIMVYPIFMNLKTRDIYEAPGEWFELRSFY